MRIVSVKPTINSISYVLLGIYRFGAELAPFFHPKIIKNMGIQCKSYTLKTESGHWLGQVILSSDGMFAAVTDWGSFAYSWRSFGEDFRSFIVSLNTPYFAEKIDLSNADVWGNKRNAQQVCDGFAEKILPALQSVLKNEIELGIGWTVTESEADNV